MELIPLNVEHEGATWSLWRKDGVALAKDEDAGAWLQFARPRDIRKLINRYEEELGDLCAIVAQSGGRPATVYYLTEAQVLFLAAKSETPRANRVLKAMIAVFMLARRSLSGGQAPADELDIRLEVLKSLVHLTEHQKQLAGRLDEVGSQVAGLEQKHETIRQAMDRHWYQLERKHAALRHLICKDSPVSPLILEVLADHAHGSGLTQGEIARTLGLPVIPVRECLFAMYEKGQVRVRFQGQRVLWLHPSIKLKAVEAPPISTAG